MRVRLTPNVRGPHVQQWTHGKEPRPGSEVNARAGADGVQPSVCHLWDRSTSDPPHRRESANNEVRNLLTLCPNCHLVDQHNPPASIDPAKPTLFRRYKDPIILSPQFHPLFRRFAYLLELDSTADYDQLVAAGVELIAFINALKMGGFTTYASPILLPTRRPLSSLMASPITSADSARSNWAGSTWTCCEGIGTEPSIS
jgi:hypothetical protein